MSCTLASHVSSTAMSPALMPGRSGPLTRISTVCGSPTPNRGAARSSANVDLERERGVASDRPHDDLVAAGVGAGHDQLGLLFGEQRTRW